MNATMLVSLVNNAALLLALGLLYDVLALHPRASLSRLHQSAIGLLLGLMGIAVMMNPFQLAEGVIFDTRSVLLSITGLFFGTIPTIVAAVITASFRLSVAGGGAWPGVAVIVTSSAIGIAWRRWRGKDLATLSPLELYLFGIVVHVTMLLWMTTLPAPYNKIFLAQISLPVMVIYPLGTTLLGRLMAGRIVRRQAQESLRESEARYRSLFENNHIPMLIVDPEGGAILDANPMAAQYYGWSHESLTRMNISEINILPSEFIQIDMDRAREHELTFFEFQHRRADGSVRDVEVHSGPIQMHGRWLLYSIINDVTDRKRHDEALRESEARFRNLVDGAPIPIFIQAQGQFAYLNAAAFRAFGADSPDLLIGSSVLDRFHPVYREKVLGRIQQLNDDHRSVPMVEEICLKLDGTPFEAEVSAVPFLFEGQHGALVFFQDITARKKAENQRMHMERQIQQTQKLESLGVLAGGIAHDFNNILMAVLGHADLAQLSVPANSPARESLHEIENAARRAAELCRQMLAYSGRGNFIIETIYLRDLIEEMIHLLRTSISKKALLNLHLEKSLPPMRGDATQIRQIIMNLVINASEAIGERSGVITISTGAMDCTQEYLAETYLDEGLTPGLYIWLEVSDTGCGMDKETQSRLFEPFFTTKFTGRGLGMAAVLGIVRGHKGALKVYTELGKGTTFKALFPAVEDDLAARERKSAQAGDGWSQSGLILLVDDEETIRALGKKMIEMLGFRTLVAADGREALELYREHADEIDLVLLDLTMPHMNGEETFRELRRLNRDVRVMISSGYTESEIFSRFAGKGVAGFVQKPYTLAVLRDHLRRVLDPPKHQDTSDSDAN